MPRPHPPQFRRRAVELARLRETPIAKVAEELGIAESCLLDWLAQADINDDRREGPTSDERAELFRPSPVSRTTIRPVAGGASPWCVIRTLGPLELIIDGRQAPVGGLKQRTVFALMALRTPRSVEDDELVDAVWGNHLPSRPETVLKVYVANLRRLLRPEAPIETTATRIVRGTHGYVLETSPEVLDRLRFEELCADAERNLEYGQLERSVGQLKEALALWRGSSLPELADVASARAELVGLEERRLGAVEHVLQLDLALGRAAEVVAETERWIAEYPYREQLRVVHVMALYRGQRQVEALAACRQARVFLADELGLDPGPTLRDLESAVLRHDPSLSAPAQTAGQAHHRRRIDNVPAPPTSLVGRNDDITELLAIFREGDVRLVTLTGPGGVGKTRLALSVAETTTDEFPDGVCFVDLTPVPTDQHVLPTIAAALGVTAPTDENLADAVDAFLRSRRLLLVLDNIEHVPGAWPIPARLLRHAPQLRVLVTSRSPLGISGELTYEVNPLQLPRLRPLPPLAELERTPAVELFVERARLAHRRFTLSDENARSVVDLCRRLDGLPLALELAAAHAHTMSPDDMRRSLDDRADLLSGGPRDAARRHQALQSAIAWSHDMLAPSERIVFAQLAVFAGSPLLSDVIAVCIPSVGEPGPIVDALDRLTNVSLVQRRGSRLGMLQTIRQFAREQLAASPLGAALSRRHAEHYASHAIRDGPQLTGPGQADALSRLLDESVELNAALLWAASAEGDLELALELVGTLWHYWELAGEVITSRTIATDVVERGTNGPPALLAPALSGAGTLCWLQGDNAEATRLHELALTTYRSIDDGVGVAWSHMCLGVQAVARGDLDAADALAQDAFEQGAALGDDRTTAGSLSVLGVLAWYRQQATQAQTLQDQALAHAEAAGDAWLTALIRVNLADIAEGCGDYERASEHLQRALLSSRRMRDRSQAVYCVEAIAELRLRTGRPAAAARLLAACDTHRTDMTLPLTEQERQLLDDIIAEIRSRIGPVDFAVAWFDGTALTLDEAIDEAVLA